MFTRFNPSNRFPTDRKDLLTDELTRIYAVVASYIQDNEFVVQITIGNQLPCYDEVRLIKMFVCSDEDEMQRSLAIVFQDKNYWVNRLLQ